MSTEEERERIQAARDTVQYDVCQRELDRALDGYNSVYSRVSMSLVVVGVLLGFVFMGPDETGLRGAIQTLHEKDSLLADLARWCYAGSLAGYVSALIVLLSIASHRPVFSATYHSGPWAILSEHELRKTEIEQCNELAKYYRGATRDLLWTCRSANIQIGVGVVCYVAAELLLLRV